MLLFERKDTIPEQAPVIEGLSPMLSALLYARGIRDAEAANAFLHPDAAELFDPYLFSDMERAVSRLRRAIEEGARVCIFGDYDVDGVCAVSMLFMCLHGLGANVCYHIPSRHEEGYGMSLGAVERLAAEGVQLIVTVDNGIRSIEEAERCYELGMALIVTDHHLAGEALPRCEALLCHTRPGETYPNKSICGAGTAYKLIQALLGPAAALQYLPLAGVATVADIVPLLGENRIFAAAAVERLERGDCCAGLRALCGVLDKRRRFSAWDISFGVAPRLNAAGRLGDASLGVELLCGEDAEDCARMARELDELNARRQKEEAAICEEAFAMVEQSDLTERFTIVLKGNWNSGVIGIAANRLSERYYRPTMLFSENGGVLTGSARSIPGVHLYAALLQCAGRLQRFGGHAFAAGATMQPEAFPAFCRDFEAAVRAVAAPSAFLPRKFYELEASPGELGMGLAMELEKLAPFGEGNPYPLVCSRGVYLRALRPMGDGSHLKGMLAGEGQARECTLFGMGDRYGELLDMDRCDALYIPNVNEWNGSRTLQLQLKAARPARPEDPEKYVEARREKFYDAFSRNILYNSACNGLTPETDPDGWLESALERYAGALVLCFTPEGAARLLRRDIYGRMDVRFFHEPKGPCAYHAAVLAPDLAAMRPERYRSILVYDTPVTSGVCGRLRALAPEADIHACCGDAASLRRALRFTREELGAMYRALRGAERTFYNRAALGEYLRHCTGLPAYLCRLGSDVLAELGFAKEEKTVAFAPDAPRAELDASVTYRALQALQEQQ